MTDKELLEYVAKAANIAVEFYETHGYWVCKITNNYGPNNKWNPLEDSKDAFELMTKLKISVVMDSYEEYVCAQYCNYDQKIFLEQIVYCSGDLNKDYRLAITTCAAKIALT